MSHAHNYVEYLCHVDMGITAKQKSMNNRSLLDESMLLAFVFITLDVHSHNPQYLEHFVFLVVKGNLSPNFNVLKSESAKIPLILYVICTLDWNEDSGGSHKTETYATKIIVIHILF